MKRTITLLLGFALLCACNPLNYKQFPQPYPLQPGALDFNAAWSFSLDGAPARTVDLPHDWGVEGEFRQEYPGETGKLRWWGRGEYSKSLEITPEDEGKSFFLEVDGAMSGAEVTVNGTPVGGR